MSNLILNQKDIFRTERLFSERVFGPISTNTFYQTDDGFNRSISRLVNDTKKYRVVRL
jgi:hypothetical protein